MKSVNIPFTTPFPSDGTLDHSSLRNCKGKIIVVIGSNKDKTASEVSFILYVKFCQLSEYVLVNEIFYGFYLWLWFVIRDF